MNKVGLKQVTPSKLGIENGLISLIMSISGTLDNIVHKENLLIENLKLKEKL